MTRTQLESIGLSRGQIERYRSNNRLIDVQRGVARAAGAPSMAHRSPLAS